MAQYGQVIDPEYNPDKEHIYNIFTEYFNNPLMSKIKNVDNYSMYLAKIHCMLAIEHRYLIAMIPNDYRPIGSAITLGSLNWVSLQTRLLKENYNLPPHSYQPRRFPPLLDIITLSHKDNKAYYYKATKLPLDITLLTHKADQIEYQSQGNIITALETYNTVVMFREL